MSSTIQRPILSVVTGEAQLTSEGRPRGALASVPSPKPSPPQQLGLQGVPAHPDTLISVGLHGMDFMTFASVVHRHAVRTVLDFRVSSSFRGSGFSIDAVFRLFEMQGIRYRRLPGLVDRRDGAFVNDHVRQRQYAMFLEKQKDVLKDIRELVRNGPAALVGWEANHVNSDRAILVDVLQSAGVERFILVIAP